ncbi:MAG: putative NarL family two-component response regulator [Chloroflexi bacterium]|nr:putative NarL family two-component response regulator [Chloroflexota bacterium]
MSGISPKIKVLIVDDHAMVRSGLAFFLQIYPDLELVGEASNGLEAIQMTAETRPDVVLMDLIMPGMDGTEAIMQIKGANEAIQVIALTSFKENELVRSALQAGAIGYLNKNVNGDELAQAIRAAFVGVYTLSTDATQALIHNVIKPTASTVIELTARERDVLALLVGGLTNQQIAQRLKVSRNTVKFHISSILNKLKVSGRTEAVAMALLHHLLN